MTDTIRLDGIDLELWPSRYLRAVAARLARNAPMGGPEAKSLAHKYVPLVR